MDGPPESLQAAKHDLAGSVVNAPQGRLLDSAGVHAGGEGAPRLELALPVVQH